MKNLTFLLSAALILIAAFVFSGNRGENLVEPGSSDALATVSASIDPFQVLRLSARAVYVSDLATGRVIFSSHGDAQLPLASLAKLITAVIALDAAGGDLEEKVYINEEALTPEGENGLVVGDSWKISDLAAFSLISSSNDAAQALALFSENKTGLGFLDLTREFAAKLNLNQTYLLNPTGLDISESAAGAYGSAKDMALVLQYALDKYSSVLNKTALAQTNFQSLGGYQYEALNTNPEVAEWPMVLASKTGFTDLAGGNLALAFEAGPARPITSVVLGSTLENRLADTELIIRTVFSQLSR